MGITSEQVVRVLSATGRHVPGLIRWGWMEGKAMGSPRYGTLDGDFAALKCGYRIRGRCFLCSNGMVMSDIRKGKRETLLERQIACAIIS